ncbi:enoyl-CoA hydratase/isomerase family protein [Acidocella sp. MX-AZ03]|uniref:enoyl-CoA hydratase/isomerase family protein n=1 Tax=Acidocella sp. MX-AZ03 TaxID=2697363 RepID=UPI0022DDF076|nr:enoyl-CoA hydratase/isomerase family protein [Acidocella sp. MX-AZ03]WBO59909.1 enoyl-CoA hydratase/isomerase family protein [Acidocella sp. MX-AZ03]
MNPPPPLLFTRESGLARITLNRPDAANTLNPEMSRALFDAAIECDEDASIRAVLLTGNGPLFCGGGDIHGFAAAGARVSHLAKEMTTILHGAVSRLARMGKPLVVAVNGPAAGAGLSLAMLGDIVIAAPAAHFTVAYTAIGLTPDLGASWLLPRLVGLRRAQELALTNRRVGAQEAAAIGLITRVADDPQAEALTVARTLAQGRARRWPAPGRCWRAAFPPGWRSRWNGKPAPLPPPCAARKGRRALRPFWPSVRRIFRNHANLAAPQGRMPKSWLMRR